MTPDTIKALAEKLDAACGMLLIQASRLEKGLAMTGLSVQQAQLDNRDVMTALRNAQMILREGTCS